MIQRLGDYGILYVAGKGRHPKFYDPDTKKSYPVKSHGKKTLILSYALSASRGHDKKIRDVFDR